MVSPPSPSWPGAFGPRDGGVWGGYRVSWRQCWYLSGLSVAKRRAFVNLHVAEFALTGGIHYVYSALALLWHGETQDFFTTGAVKLRRLRAEI